jgi:large subunit ribosomal protein L20
MRSLSYSFRGRKERRRNIRRLWISRINSACAKRTDLSLNYSKFMHLLKLSQIGLDRKNLSEIANRNPEHFDVIINKVINNPWLENNEQIKSL